MLTLNELGFKDTKDVTGTICLSVGNLHDCRWLNSPSVWIQQY